MNNDFTIVAVNDPDIMLRARIWRACYRLRRYVARKWALARHRYDKAAHRPILYKVYLKTW